MARVSPVLRSMDGGFGHWCPGCNTMHYIAVDKPLANGARWTFDGNLDAPTFGPSVRVTIPDADEDMVACCHYFIRGGEIQFCSDSTHSLAGKTVPLPEFPQSEID